MHIKIVLRNYRCFSEDNPGIFEIGDGFTSLIGPNNSGKSTALKFFFEVRHVLSYFKNIQHGINFAGFFSTPPANIGGFQPPVTDQSEVVFERARGPCQFEIHIINPVISELQVEKAVFTYFTAAQAWKIDVIGPTGERFVGDQKDGRLVAAIQANQLILADGTHFSFQLLSDAIEDLSRLLYFGPYRNALNEGSGTYFDLHIGTHFIDQWHSWKTGGNKSQNKAIGEVTEEIRRLIKAEKLEINASTELKTLQLYVDGRPHKLAELGSGIAQLIVVLANALIKKPTYIAIDEPESHLHPALQLDFLTTLAAYASKGIIFSTHSLGLARSVSDRMYSAQPGKNGTVLRPYERTPRYAEFLGSMGLAGLQELGWNKILMVEGPTDVRTFQQILRKYGKDREVIVLPLGGSSMINAKSTENLAEVTRLCKSVFAIVDSERKTSTARLSKDREGFEKNCIELQIKCLITKRTATENYLNDRAVKAVYGNQYSALKSHGLPTNEFNFWGKSENWRAAANMTKEEWDITDVGAFIGAM